jgi:hypothetical protein
MGTFPYKDVPKMKHQIPPEVPPFALSLRDFHTRFYPCSRAHATTLVKSGALESFVDGNRRMILYEKARQYVHSKAAAGGAVPTDVSASKSEAGRKGRASQLADKASA